MNVLIATGGSGGHIFPAIKVGLECQIKGFSCLFVGSLKFGKERLKEYDMPYQSIETCGWSGGRIFKAFLLSVKAMLRSFKIFKEFQPDVVIGFGGYSSFPVCLAARLRNIPTVIHEQNVVPGKANKMLSFFVQKIFLSFEKSLSFFPKKKCVVTGCPSLIEIASVSREEALRFFNFSDDRYTILVFGGSQGSQNINQVFKETVPELSKHIPIQVIHLLGHEDTAALDSMYAHENVPAYVAPFLDRMEYAYRAADLVIARSGALTVTEVLCFQKAAIFIPYPHAQSHQKENASVLTTSGCAVLMEDRALAPTALISTIRNQYERFINNQQQKYSEVYQQNPAVSILEEASVLKVS